MKFEKKASSKDNEMSVILSLLMSVFHEFYSFIRLETVKMDRET